MISWCVRRDYSAGVTETVELTAVILKLLDGRPTFWGYAFRDELILRLLVATDTYSYSDR